MGFGIDALKRPSMLRVAITSWSMETVFGGSTETWQRLLKGDSIDDNQRIEWLGSTHRAKEFARHVARQAAPNGLDRHAAIIVGTSKGDVEEWFSPPPVRPETTTSDNPTGGLSTSGLGEIASALSREFQTSGPVMTLSAACASGLHALIRGAMMIQSGEVRQALVVATEASVHPLFLANFQRLGVLAKPGGGCRPFDQHRTGFYMTDAACAVLLEVESFAQSSERPLIGSAIQIDRFAMGGDATHLTGGDPEGRLLKHLLRRVIDGRPVDLIHAHGTGTEMNDATELAALEASVVDQREKPIVYSHKAALGHSLGASGLLSVVMNCIAHTTGQLPPNVRTTEPIPTTRLTIPRVPTQRPFPRSLAIAAGFGGPTAVVSLTSDSALKSH